MNQFVVHKIETIGHSTHYISLLEDAIIDNIRIALGDDNANAYAKLIAAGVECYSIERFNQFVAVFKVTPGIDPTLSLSEFGDDIDSVLDDYMNNMGQTWTSMQREKSQP